MGRRGRRRLVIPFILPAFAVYTIIFVYPALQAVWVSLHDWNGFASKMTFIGLGNYVEMFKDRIFWSSLEKTLFISVVGGIGIFLLALFFSAVLHRPIRGKKFFRALIFFPIVVPGIGLGLIWQFIYNNSWGPLSSFLDAAGLGALDQVWLAPDLIIQSLTVAVIWTYVGFYVVILLAGIDKIPATYYEASVLDGASEWRQFISITIPMIWDVLIVAVILWVISSLKIFDLIIATTFPAPSTSTYTLTIFIWAEAIGTYTPVFRLGYASAIGVVLLALVVLAAGVIRVVMRRESIEY